LDNTNSIFEAIKIPFRMRNRDVLIVDEYVYLLSLKVFKKCNIDTARRIANYAIKNNWIEIEDYSIMPKVPIEEKNEYKFNLDMDPNMFKQYDMVELCPLPPIELDRPRLKSSSESKMGNKELKSRIDNTKVGISRKRKTRQRTPEKEKSSQKTGTGSITKKRETDIKKDEKIVPTMRTESTIKSAQLKTEEKIDKEGISKSKEQKKTRKTEDKRKRSKDTKSAEKKKSKTLDSFFGK